MVPRRVPILSIEVSAGTLRYRLDVPERDAAEPLQEEFRQSIDERTIRQLQESADALLRSPARSGFAHEARSRGNVLYRTLVPPRLREHLRTVTGPLLISTSLTGLPWELLHDDDEFWGLRYGLGKRLVLDRPLPVVTAARFRPRPRALVVGSDPRGDLPFVRDEVETVCEVLERYADITCVAGPLASFDAVSAHLGHGYDLIHYCGHVVVVPGTGPALLLADETPLPAGVIEANLGGRPLVFLNGCASARGEVASVAGGWETTASSVAHGFLFGGAVGVVATLSAVSDRHAATLAEHFYRRVMEPIPVGDALCSARIHCRAAPASADSPTWLSFVLYGNPGQVLREGEVTTPRPVTPHAAVAVRPSRRRLGWRPALALLVGGAAVAAVSYRVFHPPPPVVVGVVEVRSRSPAVPDWMRELTRDSLNTILSKYPQVRVFARQKIDFVRQRRQLSEIEAAEALGMQKMLSAVVAVDGGLVTLDLDVVDVASGMLEGSERVQGPMEHLMELETEFALRALGRVGVTPTAAEREALIAARGNDTLRAYRLLKDSLGEAGEPTEPPSPPAVVPVVPGPGASLWSFDAVAYADGGSPDEAAIQGLLDRYRAALEARDVERVASLQVEMSAVHRAALQRYFDVAPDLHVRFADVDLLVEGDDALATFTREDVFTDTGTGRRMRLEVRVTAELVRQNGEWRFRRLRDPK
jgi:TolB-like protein